MTTTSKGTFTVTDRMGVVLARYDLVAVTRFEAMGIRADLQRKARVNFPDAMYFTDWKEES